MQLLSEFLIKRGIATRSDIVGCTQEELSEAFDIAALPVDYVEFLRQMGRAAGNLFRGTDIHYPTLLEVDEWAKEFCSREDVPLSSVGKFFFAAHQGYQYYYFDIVDKSELVWVYTEGDLGPQCAGPTFLEFVWSVARVGH